MFLANNNLGVAMSFKKFACALVAVFSLASGATAATITFQFSGTIVYGAPMAVLPGTPIVGTFSYDTSTEPAFKYKGFAAYEIAAPSAISATVDGHHITAGNLNIAVWNNMNGNVQDMVTMDGGAPVLDGTTLPDGNFGMVLASGPRSKKVLKSTKLPSEFNVSDFDAGPTLTYGTFQRNGGQDGALLQFSVDSIVVLTRTP